MGFYQRKRDELWAAIGCVVSLFAVVACMNGQANSQPQEESVSNPEKTAEHGATETATLGGGCFWCVEAVYEQLKGVKSVVSGYAGGTTPNPTYKQVCDGTTGHAEAVQIEFDPSVISYSQLLEVFWKAHDPTTLNKQGGDVGPQYRSIILYHNDEQKAVAEESKASASSQFADPIVTEIEPLKEFYRAEEYHQDYFSKNPNAPYCMVVIDPKLKKLQKSGVLEPEG